MNRYKLLTLLGILLFAETLAAQNSDRDCIRMGNKYFREKEYSKAETYYRKALDKNKSLEAFYNLGNALVQQGSDSLAFGQYQKALEQVAETKEKKAYVFHNMGNLSYVSGINHMRANSPDAVKAFEQAVELYKSALRCNPQDNETRYNLAMAQYMLKKNQQNQQQNQQNQNQQQNQDKDQQQQNKDKDKQKEQQDKQDQQKDKQDQQKGQNAQQQQKDQEQQKQQQQQQQQSDGQMDDRTAEQLFNSAQQDEKAVQRKVQKGERAHRRGLNKDW